MLQMQGGQSTHRLVTLSNLMLLCKLGVNEVHPNSVFSTNVPVEYTQLITAHAVVAHMTPQNGRMSFYSAEAE